MSDEEIEDFAQDILRRARLRGQILNPDSSAPSMAMGLEAIRKRPVVPNSRELLESVKVLPVLMEESAHTRKNEIVVDSTPIDKDPIPESNETESDEDENKIPIIPPESAVSLGTRRTLRRLGELYGEEGSMPSPVRDHTIGEKTPDPTPQHLTSDKSGGRRGRLNALANTINAWEDDLSHYCSPTSRFNISPPRQARKSSLSVGPRSSPTKLNFTTPPTSNSAFGPRESQGFVSNSSKTKLTYEYSDAGGPSPVQRARSISPTKHVSLFDKQSTPGGCSPSPIGKRSASTSPVRKPAGSPVRNMPISSTPIASVANAFIRTRSPSPPKPCNYVVATPKADLSVAQKTAIFEVGNGPSTQFPATNEKDPTEMTVAQRAKLFEQQAILSGSVPVPGNNWNTGFNKRVKPFVNNNSTAQVSPKKVSAQVSFPMRGTVEAQRRLFESGGSRSGEMSEDVEESTPVMKMIQPKQVVCSSVDTPPMFVPPPAPGMRHIPAPPPLPAGDLSVTFSALASPPPASKRRSRSPTKTHGGSTPNKRSASPSPPRSSPKSKYPGLNNIKRIRVNEPKPGRIYPSLTDIESTETETESEMNPNEDDYEMEYIDEELDSETSVISGFSLGTHIERVAKQNTPRRNPHYRPTEDFSTSLACRQIDELIDDALEGQSFSMDTIMEAELNAPASSAPNACSTSVEWNGKTTKEEFWLVSDELARLNGSQDDKTLEPIHDQSQRISCDEIDNSGVSAGEQSAGPGSKSSSIVRDHYDDGPETSIDTILNNTLDEVPGENDNEEVCSSFEYTDNASSSSIQDGSPVVTSSPLYPLKRKNPSPAAAPLVHTVSFFRKQQGQAISTTPKKANIDSGTMKMPSPVKRSENDTQAVNEIIKKLEEEMAAQHRSIAQVSKALNLCKATVEFSESTENVECERVLLIASQKRTCLLNEIHRLKTEGVLSKTSLLSPTKQDLGPSCRGNMTLSDIVVTLKREFVSKALSGDTVYHFICLAKYRNHLEASSLVSIGNGVSSSRIQSGALHFPNSFSMAKLEPEFGVQVEIYVLETMKEFLPHDAKYHIKKEASKRLTPKKQKQDCKLSRPFQQSPAGPNAVRTTNFSLCGSLTIDISTLQNNHWELGGIKFTSPLEGSVAIKIQCRAEGGAEERGFLTMFDDVSGFGAWHRRWCKLTPSELQYWMYPEDENENKIPMGSIPLHLCVTTRVGPVQREICARANTLLLVTTRAPAEKDTDTLTTSCHSDYTAVRHLLTADTKEERDSWCKEINKALTNLRAWDPHAHAPDDSRFYK